MIHFAFFGTDEFSLGVLEELLKHGLTPSLLVTAPTHVIHTYADAESIPSLQPTSLKEVPHELAQEPWDLFVVASYGKIIPQSILNLPTHGTLNVHPSLLPLYRGPSPIESTILSGDRETGVTIMLVDSEVDHGHIVAQERCVLTGTEYYPDLAMELAERGGKLLAETIPPWIAGTLTTRTQDHTHASYTKKIKAEDGLIELDGNAVENYRKVRAYLPWPKAFYLHQKESTQIRVAITRAHVDTEGNFVIDRVIPAGKREMPYSDFLRGLR